VIKHSDINDAALREKIRKGRIRFGGNEKLKIYGSLSCRSGKRMKKENRVFFATEKEAIKKGYRPCGHCMKNKYQEWKAQSKDGS
jgi:methylphosphotriester-DNA--protein-cysteine methyltransferase